MVSSVITSSWNSAEVKTAGTDVNIRAVQTPIADMVCRLTAGIAPVAGVQSV